MMTYEQSRYLNAIANAEYFEKTRLGASMSKDCRRDAMHWLRAWGREMSRRSS